MQYAFIVTFPKKRFIVDISTDSDQTKTFQLERIENGFHVNPALLTIIILYCPSSNRDHFVFNYFVWLIFFLFLVLNATFSNISAISWRSALVVEEAGVNGENQRPSASNW